MLLTSLTRSPIAHFRPHPVRPPVVMRVPMPIATAQPARPLTTRVRAESRMGISPLFFALAVLGVSVFCTVWERSQHPTYRKGLSIPTDMDDLSFRIILLQMLERNDVEALKELVRLNKNKYRERYPRCPHSPSRSDSHTGVVPLISKTNPNRHFFLLPAHRK